MDLPSINTDEEFARHFRDDFWLRSARVILDSHGIFPQNLRRSEQAENIVFLGDESFIVKIYIPFRDGYRREKAALEFVRGKTRLVAPEIIGEGGMGGLNYLITTQIEGRPLSRNV